MSLFRNLVGTKSKPQDSSLALTHLRKLFGEFRHPSKKATQEEQESKLYSMIPVFCKVCHCTGVFDECQVYIIVQTF